jgi:hypothetical protein
MILSAYKKHWRLRSINNFILFICIAMYLLWSCLMFEKLPGSNFGLKAGYSVGVYSFSSVSAGIYRGSAFKWATRFTVFHTNSLHFYHWTLFPPPHPPTPPPSPPSPPPSLIRPKSRFCVQLICLFFGICVRGRNDLFNNIASIWNWMRHAVA